MEEFFVGISRKKKTLEIPEKVNVGYYSGRGPNHSKTTVLLTFPVDSSRFIAAPQPRGANRGVGSNFTPTAWR